LQPDNPSPLRWRPGLPAWLPPSRQVGKNGKSRRKHDREAVALVKKCLSFYQSKAQFKTRSASFMDHIGIDELKKELFGS
jgi:hypothetical protein